MGAYVMSVRGRYGITFLDWNSGTEVWTLQVPTGYDFSGFIQNGTFDSSGVFHFDGSQIRGPWSNGTMWPLDHTLDTMTGWGAKVVFEDEGISAYNGRLFKQGDGLGSAVAIDGQTALAAAPTAHQYASGSWPYVKVYDVSGATPVLGNINSGLTHNGNSTPPGAVNYEGAGRSVSVSNNYMVIGDPDFHGTKGHAQGRVRVYYRLNGQWASFLGGTSGLTGLTSGERFGSSVAINASSDGSVIRVAIGAPHYDFPDVWAGMVHVYEWVDGAWQAQSFHDQLHQKGSARNDRFGFSVALTRAHSSNDGMLVVGSPWGSNGAGYVSLFKYYAYPSESRWERIAYLVGHGSDLYNTGSSFGYSVSISGGYNTTRLAIGAVGYKDIKGHRLGRAASQRKGMVTVTIIATTTATC